MPVPISLKANRVSLAKTLILFFMLSPVMGLLKVWPLPLAITTGLVLLAVGTFLGLMLGGKEKSDFRFNKGIFFFLGLILALVISVQTNNYAYEATWRWYLISFIVSIMVLVAASEFKGYSSTKFHNSVAHSLWVGSFVYAVMSLLKYYGFLGLMIPWIEPSGGRLSGMWAQPNLTTTTCWLGVLAASVAMPGKQHKGWWYASVVIFGWTLACAASRMSWLIIFGLVALIFVSRLQRYKTEGTLDVNRSLGQGIFVVVVLLVSAPYINQPIHEALATWGLLEQAPITSLTNREVFQDSARLTEFSKLLSVPDTFSWNQWLFGVGPGNYPAFSYRADMELPPEGLMAGTWLHSHNIFTMIFVEFGLFGLAIVLLFVGTIAVSALSSRLNASRFFAIGGIGILFIHSNLEFPLWNLWFLVLFCLLLTNLFNVREFRGDSTWLKPVVGFSSLTMVVFLLMNVGYQYIRIAQVASENKRDIEDYQALAFLANDSLMGPYAVLRRYRDFAPELSNLDWQLREVRKMKSWQPRDLVVLREFSLLVLKQNVPEACVVANRSAYRYPYSAPIMFDHAVMAKVLTSVQIASLANCIEEGLAPRGETIVSMREKNKLRIAN
ncbi:MAG: Lipid A core--O-antigen ligase [Marinobacter sp. T13-3]|nr:MAG: Lipid A core--O-antigen ligase [Marinobacter sp. T13-3]